MHFNQIKKDKVLQMKYYKSYITEQNKKVKIGYLKRKKEIKSIH